MTVLTEFGNLYSKDLVLDCFGKEAELYAEDFKITESFYEKYTDTLVKNQDLISNKTIIDVGCGTGVWSIIMCMLGAKNVISIEPRGKFYNGLKSFLSKHEFPIIPVQGFHNASFEYVADTIILMGVTDIIPDVVTFMSKLSVHADYAIIKNSVYDIPDDHTLTKLNHNLYHRAGFNFNQLKKIDPVSGYQTNIFDYVDEPNQGLHLQYCFGKNYFETLAKYLDYTVLKNYESKSNSFRITTLALNQSKVI